jgi:hypothetical protein
LYNIKIKNALPKRIAQDLDIDNLDTNLANSEIFLDSFKMACATRKNKLIAKELLKNYLLKKTIPFKEFPHAYPYSEPQNLEWISSILGSDAHNWFAQNKKVTRVYNGERNKKNKIPDNYFLIARNKLRQIGSNIDDHASFEIIQAEFIRLKSIPSTNQSVLNDVQIQLNNIQAADSAEEIILDGSVTIYRELHPLKILMMGNWFNGSCLSYYSNTDSFWSNFSNAVDANKAVFYIESKNKLIARVLVAITNDKKIIRFPIYYAAKTFELDSAFNTYIQEIALKCNMGINGSLNEIKNILSEDWYKDPEKNI